MEDFVKFAADNFAEQYGFASGVAAGLFKSALLANLAPLLISLVAFVIALSLIKHSLRVITNSFKFIFSVIFYLLVVLLGMHFYNIGLPATILILKNNALQLSQVIYTQLKQTSSTFADKFP